MDLYSITIMFKGTSNIARLMFKYMATFEETKKAILDMPIGPASAREFRLVDDYGKIVLFKESEYSVMSFAHLNQELEATQDETLLQAHCQVKFQKRVEQDPILREVQQKANANSKLFGLNGSAGKFQ